MRCLFPLLFSFCIAASPTVLLAQDGKKGEEKAAYTMKWSTTWSAREEAKKSRYGILYYFPADDAEGDHEVFQDDELMAQSLRSPVVRVTNDDRETLVELYEIDVEAESIVVTDWHGNLIEKFEIKKKRRQKFPVAEMIKLVQDCGEHVKRLRVQAQKALKEGQKLFEKGKYTRALKELLSISKMTGFPECEKARSILQEINDLGRQELSKIKTLKYTDKEAAIKELKKIVKNYEGSEVAKEAAAELETLGE